MSFNSKYKGSEVEALLDKVASGEGEVSASIFGTCSDVFYVSNKTVYIDGDFVLKNNVRISVLFTASNTATNLTMNVNDTGAYPIKWKGASSATLSANQIYDFMFYEDVWYLLGGVDTDTTTDIKVTQNLTSSSSLYNYPYPLLFSNTANKDRTSADTARFATDLKYNPITRELYHGGLSFRDSNGNTLGLPTVTESTTLVDKVYVDNIVGDISTILDNLNGEEV